MRNAIVEEFMTVLVLALFHVMAYGRNVFMIDYAMPDSNLYAADAQIR